MNPVRHLMASVSSVASVRPTLPTLNILRLPRMTVPSTPVDREKRLADVLGSHWRYTTSSDGTIDYVTNGAEGAPKLVIYQAGFSVGPLDLDLMARVLETGRSETVDAHVAVMFMKPIPLTEHAHHVGRLAGELSGGRAVTTISQSAGAAVCRAAAALYPPEITHHMEFNSVGNAHMYGAKYWFQDVEYQAVADAAMALAKVGTDESRLREGVWQLTHGDDKKMTRMQTLLGAAWRSCNNTMRSAEFVASGLTGPYALSGLSRSALRLAEFFNEDREAASNIKALCSSLWVQPYLEHLADLKTAGQKTPHFLMVRSVNDTVCQRHMFDSARKILQPYCALELPRLSHGLGHAPPAVRHLIQIGKDATVQLHDGADPSVVAQLIYAEGVRHRMSRKELGERWNGQGPVGLEPPSLVGD